MLDKGQDVLFEGNPYVPRAIWGLEELADVEILRVFLSPLCRQEIIWFRQQGVVNIREMLVDMMRRKLLRRTQKQRAALLSKI